MPLTKSPACKGQKRHLWGDEKQLHNTAAGSTVERTCKVCGCRREAFHSNSRIYSSYVYYFPVKDAAPA